MAESTGSGGLGPEVEQVARDINRQVLVWIGQERPPDPERVREATDDWLGRLGLLGVEARPQRWYQSPVSGELADRFHATYLASDDPLLKAVARQLVHPEHLGELAQVWQSERLRQIDALGRGEREAPEPTGQDAVDRVHARARADNHLEWTLPAETAGILREQLFAVARQGSDVIRRLMVEGNVTAADVAMVASTVMTEANSVHSANTTLGALAEIAQPPAPSATETPAERLAATKANIARIEATGAHSLETMHLAVRDAPERFVGAGPNVPSAPRRRDLPGAGDNHESLTYAREDALVGRIKALGDQPQREALLRLVGPHISLPDSGHGVPPDQPAELSQVRGEAIELVRLRLQNRFIGLGRWAETMQESPLAAETTQLAALTKHALVQVSTLNAAVGRGPAAHQVAALAIGPGAGVDTSGNRRETSPFRIGGQLGGAAQRAEEGPVRRQG